MDLFQGLTVATGTQAYGEKQEALRILLAIVTTVFVLLPVVERLKCSLNH